MKKYLLLLLLFSLNSQATPLQLVTGSFPPFVGEDQKNGGLTSELIERVFSAMNQPIEINFKPWKRGYTGTLNNIYFATFPYTKNKQREKAFYFSDAMYNLEEFFFGLQQSHLTYQHPADLTNLKICKPLGYNLLGLEKLVDNGTITLARPKSMLHCFKMLALGRVDLVMTNPIIALHSIKSVFTNPKDVTMLPHSFVKISHYLIIPKSNPQSKNMIKAFNESLKKLKAQGALAQINAKINQEEAPTLANNTH